jgi:molecular chaperone DnaJ
VSAQRDYYEVLGIARNADPRAIRDAFRNLALKYHPDRNKEAGSEERFKEIAEAYAILSDPKKRADYDARGFAGVAGFSREDLFGGINFEDIFGGLILVLMLAEVARLKVFFIAAAPGRHMAPTSKLICLCHWSG